MRRHGYSDWLNSNHTMPDLDPKIAELEARLDSLVRTQIDFQTEISSIRKELSKLRGAKPPAHPAVPTTTRLDEQKAQPSDPTVSHYKQPSQPPPKSTDDTSYTVPPPTFGMRTDEPRIGASAQFDNAFSRYLSSYADSARSDLEKFIGENLISKIGIIVLVLGVGIGAKYAIDNGWISPLMRIVFGYAMGFGLIGFAVRLKAKYHNFSSVLLSGGMAIMYLVTYFAYAYYALMPQSAAFVLMAIFTVFTVAAAILYDRQVIAHIGLVGAYAVPFLLSNNSGNYLFLFSYMAIINIGILAVSVKKYWKPIFYTSFGFTWLIFYGWFVSKYSSAEHFYLALIFLAIFFATFYATKIIHGVLHFESDDAENLIAIFITAFVFYGFSFAISDTQADVREYAVFFTYLAVISLAILLTSYRFYGRVLVYLSYPFTWLIFGAWFVTEYRAHEHFYLAAIFATVFFAIYYVAALVYRLLTDEIGMIENTGLVLTNSFVFYGFGYVIMGSREGLQGFEGLFTAAHALFHSLVAQTVSRFKASAVDVIQVLAILIVTFATIAIPVQFDGNRVTLIWTVEAAALFWFGRARQIPLFEYFSYPIMVLATGSLLVDWIVAYGERTMYVSQFNRQPLANGDFITALVFIGAFAFIYTTNRDKRHEAAISVDLVRLLGFSVAAVGLFVLYNTFRIEIGNYYHIQAVAPIPRDVETPFGLYDDLQRFNFLWQVIYSMFFLIGMSVANLRKLRSKGLAYVNVALGILCLVIFSTACMVAFSQLRQSYMSSVLDAIFTERLMYIAIRYISYLFAGGLLYSLYLYCRGELVAEWIPKKARTDGFDLFLSLILLIVASCELVNLMGQFLIPDAYKLGLSVLWGVYAVVLIIMGIAWNKKHLRIAAIVLLGVTLAKLFLYDIADLDTISKTILFVSLGLLMLIVSFLYTKYKGLIFKTEARQEKSD